MLLFLRPDTLSFNSAISAAVGAPMEKLNEFGWTAVADMEAS